MFEKWKARWRELRGAETRFEPPSPVDGDAASRLREGIERLHADAAGRYEQFLLFGRPIRIPRGERDLFDFLHRAGLASRITRSLYAPRVRLFSLDGKIIATDLLSHSARDQVFSLMFEQVYLVRNMRVRAGDRVLETCVGSGVNSLFAADKADSVTGIDISPRALAFALFNASLNGRPDAMELLEGSLFDPVAGRRFDLILVNPPFELMPPDESGHLHSDGGEDGLDVVREILAVVDDHLEPDGRMEMITWSPGTEAGPTLGPILSEALSDHRLTVHLLGKDPLDDCIDRYRDRPGYEEWRQRLRRRSIDCVHMLFVRAERGGAPGLELQTPDSEIAACHAISDAWL